MRVEKHKCPASRVHAIRLRRFACALLSLCFATSTQSAPTGAQVQHGQVSIDTSIPGVTNITNTPNAIINWQDFSVQQNEVTRFIQQNASSAVLNRVVGQSPSQILGQLLSNGRVFLINPNGVVFGQHAIVDTAGLITSSLNLSDANFLAGKLNFTPHAGAGDITNHGLIRTGKNGEIILIAPNIENSGIIQTDGGRLILAAGEKLTITSLDSLDIRFEIQAPENEVVNLGQLLSNGGPVDVFAGTIRHEGTISANSVQVDEQGNIRLIAQQDITLTTDSMTRAQGGAIQIESALGEVLQQGTLEANRISMTGKMVNNVGLTEATATDTHQAEISIQADSMIQQGILRASGGEISFAADSLYHEGITSTDNLNGEGGNITITTRYRHDGTGGSLISAKGATGGRISLDGGDGQIATSATLDAGGTEAGGTVEVTAQQVALLNATLKADGGIIGGTVHVGGEWQGSGDLRHAKEVMVGIGTELSATGERGGKIVTWSTESTSFYGAADASGIENMGGRIELSSLGALDWLGSDVAPITPGAGGTFLLDPKNIVIENWGYGAGAVSDALYATTPSGTLDLSTASITTVLREGTTLALQANNDISVLNDIIVSAGGTGGDFSLHAGRSVLLKANITTDGGNLDIVANQLLSAGPIDAQRDTGAAVISMADGTTINAGTGNVTLILESDPSKANNNSGDITVEQITAANVIIRNKGVTAGSDIIKSSANSLISAVNLALSATGGIDVNTAVSTILAAESTVAGDAIINNTGALTVGSFDGISGITTTASDINLSSTGNITIDNALAAGGSGVVTVTVDSDNNSVSILEVNAAIDGDSVTLAGLGNNDTIDINADITGTVGGIVLSNALVDIGATVDAGANLLDAATSTVDFTGARIINSPFNAGILNIDAGGSVTLNGVSNAGVLNFSGGALTGTGNLNLSGNSTWSGGTMDMLVTNTSTGNLTNFNGTLSGTGTLVNQGIITQDGALTIDGLFINQGTFNLTNDHNITGTGTFRNEALLQKSGGAWNAEFFTTFEGDDGIIDVQGGATSAIVLHDAATLNGALTINNGSLVVNNGSTLLDGLSIAGTGKLSLGGTTNIAGALNINNSITLLLSGIINGNLTNTGTANQIGALEINGQLTNQGIYDIQDDHNITGIGSFSNQGTLQKSAGTWDTAVYATFNNDAGIVDIQSGRIQLHNGGSFNNTLTINSGPLEFAAGTYIFNSGTSVNGGGTLRATGATLQINGGTTTFTKGLNLESGILTGTGTLVGNVTNTGGTIAPGNSPGILTILGDYTQDASGLLSMEITGQTQGNEYDVLMITGNATLAGNLLVNVQAPYNNQAQAGDVFSIIQPTGAFSGTFDNIQIPTGFEYIQTTVGNVEVTVGNVEVTSLPVTAPAGGRDGANQDASDEVVILQRSISMAQERATNGPTPASSTQPDNETSTGSSSEEPAATNSDEYAGNTGIPQSPGMRYLGGDEGICR